MKKNNQTEKNKNSATNKQNKTLKKVLVSLLLIMIILPILLFGGFMGYLYFGGEKPDLTMLDFSTHNIKVYDNNNTLLNLNSYDEYATIEEIPDLLKNAFVAVEDKRFYSHDGVDFIRIGGAILNNLKGNSTQGASTITQQLVKNIYLSSEQTFSRKIKEIQMALKLERQLSKDEIMNSYLNMLYFGSGEYGVKNASKRFFDKELNELNALECAMLAGIVKSPTKYNPINNYDNSITRARLVLSLMFEQGFIEENIHNDYKNSDITIKNTLIENNIDKNYLNNAIYEACNILNTDKNTLSKNGYKIYTFYDNYSQQNLYSTIQNKEYYPSQSTKSIGILCDNNTRGIKAFCSRYDINIFEFSRQVGSTIKPLASYTPALDQGLISPLQKILDEPTSFGDYSPSNYQDIYYGWTSIEDCVCKSLNVPAVKVLQDLGIETSLNYLSKMDINLQNDENNLAIALGGTTYGISMINLLGGYCTLANYGSYIPPTFIKEIRDNQNNVLYDFNSKMATKVFDEQSSYLMTSMLNKCSQTGTAKKLNSLNFDIACKTGTVAVQNSDLNSDIYSVGYTSQNTFLFWQGDDNLPNNYTGGGATTLMARNYLQNYYKDNYPEDFIVPQGIKEIKIDKYSYNQLNEIVLASKNAPISTTISTYVSEKCMPKAYDGTYDNLIVDNIEFVKNNGYVTIKFLSNPKLGYKIYKRSFAKESLIYDIFGKNQPIELNIDCHELFGSKITIVPYYIDDNGNEIIGTPSKFYSTAFTRRL